MNLFIMVFLSLGGSIGILMYMISSIKSFFKDKLSNMLTGELPLIEGAGGKSKVEFLKDKPKAQDPAAVNNDQAQPTSMQPSYQQPSYMMNKDFSNLENMGNMNMSAPSGGGGVGVVVGLVNAIGFMSQGGNIRNMGRQITGFMRQIGKNYTRQIKGGRKGIVINQSNSQIVNAIKGGRPTLYERGRSNTYISQNRKVRIDSKNSKHSITSPNINMRRLTRPSIFFEQGVHRFVAKRSKIGILPGKNGITTRDILKGKANGNAIGNGNGAIKYIAIPVTMSGKQFTGESMPMFRDPENAKLGIRELASLFAFNQALLQTELKGGLSENYIQMMRNPEFRKLMRTMIEMAPDADAQSKANLVMLMRQLYDDMNGRRQGISTANRPNMYNNTRQGLKNGESGLSNRLQLLDANGVDGKPTQGTKSQEEIEEQARKNVRDRKTSRVQSSEEEALGEGFSEEEQMVEEISRTILQKDVELTSEEEAEIDRKAREQVKIRDGMTSDEIEAKVERKKATLTKKAKEDKVNMAKDQMKELIVQEPDQIKQILGDQGFDKIVDKIKEIESKEEKAKKGKEARRRNREIAAEQLRRRSRQEQNVMLNSGENDDKDEDNSNNREVTATPIRTKDNLTAYREDKKTDI